MKRYATLGLVFATFFAGLLIGREYFPKRSNSGADQPDPGSGSSKKQLFSEHRPSGSRSSASKDGKSSPSDDRTTNPATGAPTVTELLELVDTRDPFTTNNHLNGALGMLGIEQLEALLAGFEDVPVSDPRFYTARAAVFNHMAKADPAHTFAFTASHPDKTFRSSFIPIAARALAEVDLAAARRALADLDDKNLRNAARASVIGAAIKNSPLLIAELLDEADDSTPAHQTFLSPYSSPYLWSSVSPFGSTGYTVFQSNTSQLVGQWAERDPAAAEAYARGISDSGKRIAALGAIAQTMAQKDPEAALAWARALDKSDGQQNAIVSVVGVMAQKDPEQVSGLIDELVTPQQRSSLLQTIASQWIQKDPEAGMAWLESLPSSQARAYAYNSAIYQVMQQDPDRAIELVDKIPLNNRNHMIPQLASSWAQKDLPAAREWVMSLESNEQNNALNSMFGTWAKEDPASAIEFLESDASADLQYRSNLFSTLTGQWAIDDRGAALDWAQGIEDETTRRSALGGIYNQWAGSSPEEAAAHLAELGDPVARETLISSLAGQWSNNDPEAALAWFDQLPAEDRDQVGGNIAQSLSYAMPDKAAEWFDRLVDAAAGDEEKLRSMAHSASNIASQWAQHDPQAAVQWADGLEDPQMRSDALGRVASTWVQFDPLGTSTWLREIPEGDVRDNAAEQLVSQISHHQPAAAFEWAESISDPDKRFNSVRNVFNNWRHRDKAAAKAAFESLTGLTPEQHEQLGRQFR